MSGSVAASSPASRRRTSPCSRRFTSLPAGATASYQVHACDSAAAAANRSWSVHRTSPELYLTRSPSALTATPDPDGDLAARESASTTTSPVGDVPADGRYAEQRFTAPAGTRDHRCAKSGAISATVRRYWRNYGQIDGVDQPSETCFRAVRARRSAGSVALKVFSCPQRARHRLRRSLRHDVTASCLTARRCTRVWATGSLRDGHSRRHRGSDRRRRPTATGLADGNWHRGAWDAHFHGRRQHRRPGSAVSWRVRRRAPLRRLRTRPTGGCGTLNSGTPTRTCSRAPARGG